MIGALGTLAADCDGIWRQRRRVLDTLPVMLFVFRLVCAPRRHGYPTVLAELWTRYRALVVPLSLPVSDTAPSQVRLKLDENGFKPFHLESLRRDAPSGPLSSRLLVQTRLPVDFDLVAHGSECGAARAQHLESPRCASVCVSASPSSPFAPALPVLATLPTSGLGMGPMPTPPEGAMDVTGPLVGGKNTRIHTQNPKVSAKFLKLVPLRVGPYPNRATIRQIDGDVDQWRTPQECRSVVLIDGTTSERL